MYVNIFFFSSILWTKYGLLIDDTPICVVGILGIILQSLYLAFYFINSRDRDKVSSSVQVQFYVSTH